MRHEVLRTPDERFEGLPGFAYTPHYNDLDGLRVARIDEGPRDGPVALLMHGEPSWSYLYRTMIPPLVTAGFRVVAPDLVGFGRSDKPTDPRAYSSQTHVAWMGSPGDENQRENHTLRRISECCAPRVRQLQA